MAFYATTQYWVEPPPSASIGVEGSGAVSGSGESVKRVKKESIGVLRVGDFVSELPCSSSFA
jgi:NADPH:quinone reductase-like Zn-dependent oxidoreductase